MFKRVRTSFNEKMIPIDIQVGTSKVMLVSHTLCNG